MFFTNGHVQCPLKQDGFTLRAMVRPPGVFSAAAAEISTGCAFHGDDHANELGVIECDAPSEHSAEAMSDNSYALTSLEVCPLHGFQQQFRNVIRAIGISANVREIGLVANARQPPVKLHQ
jgi:hypothetical protein